MAKIFHQKYYLCHFSSVCIHWYIYIYFGNHNNYASDYSLWQFCIIHYKKFIIFQVLLTLNSPSTAFLYCSSPPSSRCTVLSLHSHTSVAHSLIRCWSWDTKITPPYKSNYINLHKRNLNLNIKGETVQVVIFAVGVSDKWCG